MTRINLLSNPLLLGFEDIERMIERATKGADSGYPPYNIERVDSSEDGEASEESAHLLRITLAVAGFARSDLEITLEDNQLTISGRQKDDLSKRYLHRGIAARQFKKTFVLADGIEVRRADLSNGLLAIDLERLVPEPLKKRIAIGGSKDDDG